VASCCGVGSPRQQAARAVGSEGGREVEGRPAAGGAAAGGRPAAGAGGGCKGKKPPGGCSSVWRGRNPNLIPYWKLNPCPKQGWEWY
jgi:hypothetical protein